jgi:PEP-CTERM motif
VTWPLGELHLLISPGTSFFRILQGAASVPKTSDRSNRRGNLEHKLAAYALAGGAVVAATAGEAKAGLITTDVNQTIGTGAGQNTTYDLTIGGTTILEFSTSSDAVSYAQILVTPSSTSSIVAPVNDIYATNLAAGAMVSASSSFGGNNQLKILSTYFSMGGQNNGNFANVSSGYLGFSFADPTVASQTDYGYVALSNSFGTTAPSATLTIDSFTYDNTGAAVIVGTTAVPEPASLTMLAMGAAGVGVYLARRRKKTA